jgi:hypothetical protein
MSDTDALDGHGELKAWARVRRAIEAMTIVFAAITAELGADRDRGRMGRGDLPSEGAAQVVA